MTMRKKRGHRLLGIGLFIATFISHQVSAAPQSCQDVDSVLTRDRANEYASLIVEALSENTKIKSSQVNIFRFFQFNNWSAVYAATPVADPGVFFFESVQDRKMFRRVWGGLAEPSEARELIKWAENVGIPPVLARCFAHEVTSSH